MQDTRAAVDHVISKRHAKPSPFLLGYTGARLAGTPVVGNRPIAVYQTQKLEVLLLEVWVKARLRFSFCERCSELVQ